MPFILSRRPLLAIACALATLLAVAGCKSRGDERAAKGTPEWIYSQAQEDLKGNNFKGAIEKLELIEARYPFSNPARQGQLDLMYAYHKNFEAESAIDQADQFIRENPTHPRVDYAYYIKGLVYFESGGDWLERVFNVDTSKRPPSEARKSLQAFQALLQQFPKSPYSPDARQRMIYLRNRLADYELAVARYYMKRGAYVGAVNRARSVIETYDGSPAAMEALQIMSKAYRKLGIDELAGKAESVYAANASLPDITEPAAETAGLATNQPGAYGPATGGADRAGRWEARGGVAFQNSATTDFKGGTKVNVASSTGFVLGARYNFTDRLAAGASLSYDNRDYNADVAGDEPGEVFPVKGELTTTSLMVSGDYDFLAGRLTPFVTGGLGWTWVDTNIATEPPDIGCWWDPWWGYVCTAFQDTKTTSGFAYELGVGLRYDINEYLVADGLYKIKWIAFDNSQGTPSYDGFQINFGYKF